MRPVLVLVLGLISSPAWAQCSRDRDCPGEDVCIAGKCVREAPPQLASCTADKDCAGDAVCDRGRCVLPAAPAAAPGPASVPSAPPPPPTTLSIRTSPAGAMVVIDGQRAGTTPIVLPTSAGTHVVELELPGHAPVKRAVSISPGLDAELSVELVMTPEALAQRKAEEERQTRAAEARAAFEKEHQAWDTATAPARAARRGGTVGGAIALGVGGAGLVAAAVMYGVSISNGNAAHASYRASSDVAQISASRDRIAEASALLVAAHVTAGVSAAVALTGVILLATRPAVAPEPTPPAVSLTPVITPGAVGLALGGRW